jgi:hypothetical protein
MKENKVIFALSVKKRKVTSGRGGNHQSLPARRIAFTADWQDTRNTAAAPLIPGIPLAE